MLNSLQGGQPGLVRIMRIWDIECRTSEVCVAQMKTLGQGEAQYCSVYIWQGDPMAFNICVCIVVDAHVYQRVYIHAHTCICM